MAKRRKSTKKQEETLVDLVEAKEQAQDYYTQNQGLILTVVTGLLIVVGGYLAYKYLIQEPKVRDAAEMIYKAEEQFARDSFALALESPGGEFEGFLDIIDNYSGTPTANLAKYYAGISYLNLGRYQDAIDYLESHDASGKITPIMKYGALGDAYSELGQFDKAISMYKKGTSNGDNEILVPYYMEKLGLLYRKQGQEEEAQKVFKSIKEDFPGTTIGQDISKYITE